MPRFLGKKPIKLENRKRLLKIENYLDLAKFPPIPTAYDASLGKVKVWGMDGNDVCSNCTIAAAAHWILSATSAIGNPCDPDTNLCEGQYSYLGGYVKGDPSTDNGLDPTVVLNAWRKDGLFGFHVGGKITTPFHKIGAYVTVPITRPDLIMASIYLFGGIYQGIQLPANWEEQGVVAWSRNPPKSTGEYAPDPDNGHMIMASKYDVKGNTYPITWGEQVVMSTAYRNLYTDCIFAVLSVDFLDPKTGLSPAGFNIDALNEDLQLVTTE